MAGTTGVTIRVVSNKIPAYVAHLRPGVAEDVETTAREIEAGAKQLAPVLTGTLRRSIHTVLSNGGLSAVIGPSVNYAIYVEMGTRFMGARPYMRPAAAQHLPKLVPRIKKRLAAG